MRALCCACAFLCIAVAGVHAASPSPDVRRQTPTLVPCRAGATLSEDELEVWKRLRATLDLAPPLDGSSVLVARMVARPSFFSEWVVSVYLPGAGTGRVEAVIADKSVYGANYTRKGDVVILRQKPAAVGVDRYAASVSRETAEAIGNAWASGVRDARMLPPGAWVAFDGTTYTFSRWVRGEGEICGETHEPTEGSLPARLLVLADDLLEYVRASEAERGKISERLLERANLLSSELTER